MTKPHDSQLISIIMPAYNAERTIVKSLNSLIFQSYKFWECIVVDDGSVDDTYSLVKSFDDQRIKCIRLRENKGRGFARQIALENCKGCFLAMLDSDDWIHPFKLEAQLQVFIKYPYVDLVGCGLGTIDKTGYLKGVRSKGDMKVKIYELPGKVPLAHAPSMLKMKLAKELNYDGRFLLAQDIDFLRRYLLGRKYIVLDKVLYYYTEYDTYSLKKILSAYYYNIRGLIKFFKKYPKVAFLNVTDQLLKILFLIVFDLFGQSEYVINRRSIPPSFQDLSAFKECQALIFDSDTLHKSSTDLLNTKKNNN